MFQSSEAVAHKGCQSGTWDNFKVLISRSKASGWTFTELKVLLCNLAPDHE